MSASAAWGFVGGSSSQQQQQQQQHHHHNQNAASSSSTSAGVEGGAGGAAPSPMATQQTMFRVPSFGGASGTSAVAAAAAACGDPDGEAGPDPAHAVMVLRGVCSLRAKSVLTDVTLVAEGQKFDVHKVILVSCSDYFRSMFTSGMKECSQREIELKGVTARGLEKVLDIIYTSGATIEGDDVFDILAAATHLQVMPVLEFCERNFLSGMTAHNFADFIGTARLYNMGGVLAQIDKFIAANLLLIAEGPALGQLSLEQMLACLRSRHCRLREIDLFRVVRLWLEGDSTAPAVAASAGGGAVAVGREQAVVEQLLSEIRYALIAPSDLVGEVQQAADMMANSRLHGLLLQALNYHVVPHCQPVRTPPDMWLRGHRERIVCVGGRDLQPLPGLVEDASLLMMDSGAAPPPGTAAPGGQIRRQPLCPLPTPVSHAQCVSLNNFLYVLGGCVTQCGHGESAVSAVTRYDLRFDAWFQCAPMLHRRAYFTAAACGSDSGAGSRRILVVGGRRKEGALQHCEFYDPETNRWAPAPQLGQPFHSHAGAVHKDTMYISGGYSNDNFYPDVQKLRPGSQFWEDCAPMLTARGWHCMVEAGDRLFVCGGCALSASNNALPVLQCEQYDPRSDQWTIVSTMPASHKEACALTLGSRHVYVLGGFNVHTKTGQRLVSRLDLETQQWETVGSFGHSTTGVACCVLKVPPYLMPFEDAQ